MKDLEKENKRLVEDKEKWFQLCNTHKVTINKLGNQVSISEELTPEVMSVANL